MSTNPEFLSFIGMLEDDGVGSPVNENFVRLDGGLRDDTLTIGDFQVRGHVVDSIYLLKTY